MIEKWKDIENYEGLYMISNLGNCKSLPRKTNNLRGDYITKERILKPRERRHGYLCYALYNMDRKRKDISIHRLVAKAFIPNTENKPEVNHKNNIKTDNRAVNLEWMTHQENCKHASDNGFYKPLNPLGEDRGSSKLKNIDIPRIRKLSKRFEMSNKEIGVIFGVHRRTISDIINGKTWSHIK